MAEAFGVQGRGKFYEEAGAIRDVVQNHMLQVVGLLAMEPPLTTYHESIRDEQVKVFRSIRPLRPSDLVRGTVRRLPARAGRGAGLPRRDVRGGSGCTSIPGAGTAYRSSSEPANVFRSR
jgi:hypothetical protein